MKRLIIVGSPRVDGRSAHLAEMLFEANIDERPEDELFLVPVSEVEIGPCIGCGACRRETEVTYRNDSGEEITELRHRCIFDDDMQALYDLLDDADELVVVSPIYFSGAPAPMKCVLDRMQPYFWVTQWGLTKEEARALPKRPATLHVVGEGNDPHGYDALVSEVKSSLACAGFRLQRVLDWVGKIDESGEITAEATEVKLEHVANVDQAKAKAQTASPDAAGGGTRPKLDLSSGKKQAGPQAGPHDGPRKDAQKATAKQSRNRQSAKPAAAKPHGNGRSGKGKRRG